MTETAMWSWATLLGLGAFHGVNPGMGWLFAVALGMQEGRRRAVWRALLPLALGHALAIGGVVALAGLLGVMLPAGALRWPVAVILAALGVYRLLRHRHPRWGGMRAGFGDLTVWSFLMASAHGAGLMVLPVVLGMAGAQVADPGPAAHAAHMEMAMVPMGPMAQGAAAGTMATLVHGVGYLAVTAAMAWVVFEKLGLGLLRTAWLNLDQVWAIALLVTAALTVVL